MSVIGLHDALAGVHPQLSRSQRIGSHGVGIAADDLRTILAERDAQAAEIARLRERLTQAIERLRDMLKGDDGQAWDEAQRFVDIIAQETQP
jgi:hypothetical protein